MGVRYKSAVVPFEARPPRGLLSGLAVALAIVFAGAGIAGAEPPRPVFPALPAEAPAGSGAMQPCMEALEGRVRCGRYRVFEDRSARRGRTIDLAFVVADALDPAAGAADAVTFFFGGPGSSTTEPASFVIAAAREVRRRRDLLFLDFRGVGASQALDCAVPYPRGVASRFGEIFPLDHVVACRRELETRARLDLYTSAHNVDDLDDLRAWLNYPSLNLIGGSYGTREIQVYLRRHPASVRTAILSGVSPIFEQGYVTHARGLQSALDELVAECLADATCAGAYPDLGQTLERVLARVRDDPPEVLAEGESVRLGAGELGYALRGLLYQRAAEIPSLIDGAARGNWQPLADYYLARSGWVSETGGVAGMHFSVLCAEDIGRLDPETIARETAGTFLGDHLVGGYARVCENWTWARLEESFWQPVVSDVPALLFSGSRDPVTPPSGGEAVARHLANSLHLVIAGGDHVIGGPCVDRLQFEFIDSGTVEGLDAGCLEERQPTEFVLPADVQAGSPGGG